MIYCVLVIRQQNSFIGLALMLIFVIGETQALGVAVCCGLFFFFLSLFHLLVSWK